MNDMPTITTAVHDRVQHLLRGGTAADGGLLRVRCGMPGLRPPSRERSRSLPRPAHSEQRSEARNIPDKATGDSIDASDTPSTARRAMIPHPGLPTSPHAAGKDAPLQ